MNVIVLDTETTNSIEDPLCYDIGWAVVDIETGELKKTESYTVAEVFLDDELMENAYFIEKVPSYWEEIRNGSRKLAKLNTIRRTLNADCKKYAITEIYAHNARFDYRSCTCTQRFLTSSKYRYFLPYGVRICDTLKMSRQAFKTDEYKEFCKSNGFVTANNQPKYTAEVLYRYMTNNLGFEEVHKGIDDVLIEAEIMLECFRRGISDRYLW